MGALSLPPPKKKNGGKRSSKETTYEFYGLPHRFRCLQLLLKGSFSFRFLVTGPHYEITANAGDTDKKKDDDLSWTICVLKSLRVMLSDSLLRICSQSWGRSLNTTYPSPLPDHRVLLTVVFVPRAHTLASTPTGRITMLYFCT